MWLHPHVVVLFYFQTKFKVMINVYSKLAICGSSTLSMKDFIVE